MELIPEIPSLDTHFINEYIYKKNYDKIIMFYNLNGYSGQETFSNNFNKNYINKLLFENINSLIIIIDDCDIIHPNLITLSNIIQKNISGINLVLYANICNLCDEVYFKNTGGSLFILNKVNLNNKLTKYFYLNGNDSYYSVIKNVYNLNCYPVENSSYYN
jgi:hypothetical protein